MYIPIQHESGLSGLGWFIDRMIGTTRTPRGHETLTEQAAGGLIKDPADLAALINGVRLPDLAGPQDHIRPGEEKRHFLRTVTQSSLSAWDFAIDHLKTLHQQMMLSSSRVAEFTLIGEALHMVQDSFAPAHVQRDQSSGDIVSLRIYGSNAPPGSHVFRVDLRDDPFTIKPPALTPDARRAVSCTEEYLKMAMRHLQLKQLPFSTPSALMRMTERGLNVFISLRLWLQRPELRIGSQGEWVRGLVAYLNPAIVNLNLNVPLLPNDGDFNGDVRQAVLEFQKATSLAPTGIVGVETWKKVRLP